MMITKKQRRTIDNLLSEDAASIRSTYNMPVSEERRLLTEDMLELRKSANVLAEEASRDIAENFVEKVEEAVKGVVLESLASKGIYLSRLELDEMFDLGGMTRLIEGKTHSGVAQIVAKISDNVLKKTVALLEEGE